MIIPEHIMLNEIKIALPHDALSFFVVLFLAGLIACYLPARAPMRLDPVEAPRYE
jgi:ABC-type lipoprotein release transport system permease subunit